MRVSETVILSALRRGGCIRTFYRRSAVRKEGVRSVPDGFSLETPEESSDTPLSHANFEVVRKYLVKVDEWEQTVGNTLFGGETWKLNNSLWLQMASLREK
ncbi:TPA: cytoplasmic protein [Escherichia coli]|nr:cytoplasmic protein [Escherichia coli]